MARKSWYHACEVLATYDFPAVVRAEPFTQKTVPEFLEDARYRKVLATEDVAATDPAPAKRSKTSSALKRPAGVGNLTAAPPAAAALPCQRRIEPARHLTDFARRYAYSELDQHARRTIASAQWCFLSHESVCITIGRAFHMYRQTHEHAQEPLVPKAVAAELRLTVEYFSNEKL